MYGNLVTIVVPAYNAEAFLKENIESILGQTYKDLEVIYVCDGCTDRTVEILEEYKSDNRLSVVVQKENQGAAVARNIGIDMATGDWIIFLDADDLIEPNMIECMVHTALEMGADIVGCYWDIFDDVPDKNAEVRNEMRKKLCASYPIVDTQKEYRQIMQLVDKGPCTKLVHKSIYKKPEVHFQSIQSANDVYYSMVAVMNSHKIVYVDKVLWHYRTDKGRATLSTLRNQKKNYIWEACDKVYQYILSEEKNKRYLQSFCNDIFDNVCVYLKNPVYDVLVDDLQSKYFAKWQMANGEVEDKLSCFNCVIYRKLLANDRCLNHRDLIRLSKIEFVRRMSKIGCSIWGTGEQGQLLMDDIVKTDIKVQHVFDSSPTKWGTSFYGYVVENFEEVETDNILVTTSKYYAEIKKQLEGKAANVFDIDDEIRLIPK